MGSKFRHWVKRVQDTKDEEINCSECLEQVSRYVDIELATGDAAQVMPRVKHHLDQCKVCREEFMILRELSELESEGELPTNDELMERLKHRPR